MKTNRVLSLLLPLMLVMSAALFLTATPAAAHNNAVTIPAPIPVRQRIVDKLKLRAAAIRVENGFQTDIGLNGGKEIDRWPPQFQEEELVISTRLGVFDMVNVPTQNQPQEKRIPNEMPVQLRAFHKRGLSADEQGIILADMQRAIITDPDTGKKDPTLGGLAWDMRPTSDGFIVPTETFEIDGVAVGFTVYFYTEPFNAYE